MQTAKFDVTATTFGSFGILSTELAPIAPDHPCLSSPCSVPGCVSISNNSRTCPTCNTTRHGQCFDGSVAVFTVSVAPSLLRSHSLNAADSAMQDSLPLCLYEGVSPSQFSCYETDSLACIELEPTGCHRVTPEGTLFYSLTRRGNAIAIQTYPSAACDTPISTNVLDAGDCVPLMDTWLAVLLPQLSSASMRLNCDCISHGLLLGLYSLRALTCGTYGAAGSNPGSSSSSSSPLGPAAISGAVAAVVIVFALLGFFLLRRAR